MLISRSRRTWLAVVPPLLAALPTVFVLTTMAHRLPDRLATHFGPSGAADAFASRELAHGITIALSVGMAVLFGVLAARAPQRRSDQFARWDVARLLVAAAWAVAALLGAMQYSCIAVNLDVAEPATVTLPVTALLVGVAVAAVAGAAGWALAGRTPVDTRVAEAVPAIPIGSTEQVSWSRHVGSAVLPGTGAVLVAAGIVLGVTVWWVAALVLIVIGASMAALGGARVTVDRSGLTVALGLLGRPRVHVPIDDIADVVVADVTAAEFGGIGYRIIPGASGLILRSGPAIVVTRRSGRRFAVTVDDASTAAGLLGGIVGRPARSC